MSGGMFPPMKGRLLCPAHMGPQFIIGLKGCWQKPNGGMPFCQGLSGTERLDMIPVAEVWSGVKCCPDAGLSRERKRTDILWHFCEMLYKSVKHSVNE